MHDVQDQNISLDDPPAGRAHPRHELPKAPPWPPSPFTSLPLSFRRRSVFIVPPFVPPVVLVVPVSFRVRAPCERPAVFGGLVIVADKSDFGRTLEVLPGDPNRESWTLNESPPKTERWITPAGRPSRLARMRRWGQVGLPKSHSGRTRIAD